MGVTSGDAIINTREKRGRKRRITIHDLGGGKKAQWTLFAGGEVECRQASMSKEELHKEKSAIGHLE